MKKFITTLSVLAVTTAFSPLTHAQTSFSEEQTTEVQSLIESYIKENPQLIMDTLESYRVKELARIEEDAKEKAADLSESFKKDTTHPFTGNKDGDIVVVEFFDYNCGYCKKALAGVQKLIKADDNIKIVFIDLPILGESSTLASKWSLAAQEQGKYFEFHQALMNHRGQKVESELETLAETIGLDVEKLKTDVQDPKIDKMLSENKTLAESLGISGTPGFIIENEVIRGYVPYETMAELIKGLRVARDK